VSPDWALMRLILSVLADDDGLADAELAERLGMPAADVRQAARILHRQQRVDMCAGYVVAVPPRAEGRPAA
jgi:transcription initiation factor IIE alpha subunit